MHSVALRPASSSGRARATTLIAVALFGAALALYLATLAPGLSWGMDNRGTDGGELLAAVHTHGVPHPPGYPTYMLLLEGFTTLVRWGNLAHRGNLFSAVVAAAAVAVTFLAALRLSRDLMPGAPLGLALGGAALGASALATAPLFWSLATITEVYTLNALFVALLLLVTVGATRVGAQEAQRGAMSRFGLLLGLGLGNHLTILWVAIPLALWIAVARGWRTVFSLPAACALFLGLAVYVCLPLRAAADPPLNWGDPSTLAGFRWMLTGELYQGFFLNLSAERMAEKSLGIARLLLTELPPLGLCLALVGFASSRKRRGFLLASLAAMALLLAHALAFESGDFEVLLVPVVLLLSVWTSLGAIWVATRLGGVVSAMRPIARLPAALRVAVLAIIALLAVPGHALARNWKEQDRSGDRAAQGWAEYVFDRIPDGALVLTDEERWAFPLWYVGFVERPERGVVTIAVQLLRYDWYVAHLQRRHPDWVPSLSPKHPQRILMDIVRHAGTHTRVYFTFENDFVKEAYETRMSGPLYEVVGRRNKAR